MAAIIMATPSGERSKNIMYGVYNTVSKEFQFGIRAETKEEVMTKLVAKVGKDAYKWRFEVKELPSSKKPKRVVKE